MGNKFISKLGIMGLLMAAALTGCGDDGGGSSIPIASTGPSAADSSAAIRGAVSTEAAAVKLGAAGNYAILAKNGVSTVPGSVVTGNVGLSPTARVGLTGWSLIAEPTDTYFTSSQVVSPGKLYAADNAGGTTSVDLTTAVGNMGTAYTDAAGRAPGFTELYSGNLGGQILAPGVYKWSSAVLIPANITLKGSATDVWIFQVAQTLTMAADTKIILDGALAKNIFWQVAGAVTIEARSQFEGIILGQTSITMKTGAKANGRLLAQSAIILDANTVKVP